ncbi:MAG: hypothetical protein LBK73_06895 [Treponema sp.]|jgi:hypothetical protein|nr:hypothetical protein [Treponema sp.]
MKLLFLIVCLAAAPFAFVNADDSMLDALTKSAAKQGEDASDAVPPDSAAGSGSVVSETDAPISDGEEFDEASFWENYDGPDVQVIYDERSEIDYVILQTEDEYTEFHYLNHIGYSDLIFVLTDLLKRITNEGYIYASRLMTEYKHNDEVVLIYRIDKVENIAYGILQFPDFSVIVRAKKDASPDYPFNVSSPNHMMALVYQFTMALAEIEQHLGVNQLEYTRKFFKKD